MDIKKILKDIEEIKKINSLSIIDTHVHPYDVMGVVYCNEIKKIHNKKDTFKPGLMEIFKFGKIEKIGSKIFFKFFPKFVNNIIEETYKDITADTFIEEMDQSLIDKSVLLPIEPWATTEAIGETFGGNKRFFILGSIDIHKVKLKEIEDLINNFISRYNIVGLKLHPNLQNFKPQPSKNSFEIKEKLLELYKIVSQKKLYILFHGGVSYFTDSVNKKFLPGFERSRNNALLKNFCDYRGRSELFENFDFPIVIAHLGHYGIVNPDYSLMKVISKKYSNVYFDTAGASPNLIRKVIKVVSSKKIIFGTDAPYNKQIYHLIFLHQAILKTSDTKFTINKMLPEILGDNYLRKIIKM